MPRAYGHRPQRRRIFVGGGIVTEHMWGERSFWTPTDATLLPTEQHVPID